LPQNNINILSTVRFIDFVTYYSSRRS